MTDFHRRISDQLVRLIQIVFGLVLAQSLLLYKEVILHPLDENHWISLLALSTVFVTTMMSWIDWHITMELRPYNFDYKNERRRSEEIRLGVDMITVILYAYLLFSIESIVNEPSKSIAGYLTGFLLVFLAYLASGLARRHAHGPLASNPVPIIRFGAIYALLLVIYKVVFSSIPTSSSSGPYVLNALTVVGTLAVMVSYRIVRRSAGRMRQQEKDKGLKLGIDIDGVLANQIHGVLPRIKARSGISLSYDEISEWRLTVGDSDIAREIEAALADDEYVLNMPVHKGARTMADKLYEKNRIILLTARPSTSRAATKQWLSNKGFSYDELVNVKEQKKSFYGVDVLVDDYIENILEYLQKSNGLAILVSQPWNQDRTALKPWLSTRKLFIVNDLSRVAEIISDPTEISNLNLRQRLATASFL